MQWFRLYAEFATDPVVQCLAFEDQRHFIVVLCMKASGVLDRPFADAQIRVEMLKRAIGLDAKAFEEARNRLCGAGLIDADWQPRNWNKRQFISDQDPTALQRKHKQRDRERHGRVTRDSTEGVTDVSRTCHTPQSQIQIQSQITETEKTKRQRAPRSARAPTATRLPPDFELTPERRAVAETEKADPEREFANFTDFWRAASGAKARKHDWDATWRIWCRRSAEFKPVGTRKPFKAAPTTAELEAQELARAANG